MSVALRLDATDLQPTALRLSRDKPFIEKRTDLIVLYLNRPARRLCSSSTRSNRPYLWTASSRVASKGRVFETMTHDYVGTAQPRFWRPLGER